jgi:hypothetical protein
LDRDLPRVSAVFTYANADLRKSAADAIFSGLADAAAKDYSAGVLLTRGGNLKTLGFAATMVKNGTASGEAYYELDSEMQLRRSTDEKAHEWVRSKAAIPAGVITTDAASVLVIDDAKRRWRLPKGGPAFEQEAPLLRRVCREVCTERDLVQAEGTFYELPAENAGGFAKMRAIASHGMNIVDYASYRGLLVLAGVADGAAGNSHIIHSDDGKSALWVGAVDDLWELGKPRGHGGPWWKTPVKANEPSDPYLMRGYDRKVLSFSHDARDAVTILVQVDISGAGDWQPFQKIVCRPGVETTYNFPDGYSGYWLRVLSDTNCQASAQLQYE